jgi:transcriptional pleiotropic regulator of transition state genes
MKALGVVRKLDNLGRIVLPIELRRNLDVQVGDSLEIYVEDEKVILKKYNPACILCGEANDMVQHEGKTFAESV